MVTYKEITATRERTAVWPLRLVHLPTLTHAAPNSYEHQKWVADNWWMVDYHVFMEDKEKATALGRKLDAAFKSNPDHPDIPRLLDELRKLKVRQGNDRTALETWTHLAHQLVHYCGDMEMTEEIKNKLDGYKGQILEAMCGHNSYLRPLPGRTVTALDYCELSLEKYSYPERRRIECDLNQLQNDETLHFFNEGQFDAISICCGFRYPNQIDNVLKEFRRILKPSGKMSFVESPTHGFAEYAKRTYSSDAVCNALRVGGYNDIKVELIPVNGRYFEHIEGTK